MMLGKEGQGWKVSLTTLMNERVALGGGTESRRGTGPIRLLLDLWQERGGSSGSATDAVMRDRIAGLWIEYELLRLTNQRARASMRSGVPGPEGSVGKLVAAGLSERRYEGCLEVMEAGGLTSGTFTRPKPAP